MNSLSSMSILCQPSSGSFETCVAAVLELSALQTSLFLVLQFPTSFFKTIEPELVVEEMLRRICSKTGEAMNAETDTLIFEQISHRTFRGTLSKYFMSIKYLINRKFNIIIFYSKPSTLFYEKFPNSFQWIHEYFCFQPFTVTIAINAMKNSYEYHFQAVIQILSASITNIKPAFYLVDFNG